MGTNYYIRENMCESCGRYEERHIGKSSCGWNFSLRVYPEDGINTLEDWKHHLKGNQIFNEYGENIDYCELIDVITMRGRNEKWEEKPFGYDNWNDFHEQNGSQKGKNGLLQHKIDGYCIGNGDGTYDYIIGEFC